MSRYNPFPKQLEFHKSKKSYRLFVGGVASGKTTVNIWESWFQATIHHRGKAGGIYVPNWVHFEQVWFLAWKKFIPQRLWSYNRQTHILDIPHCASQIFVKSTENGAAALQGPDLAWAGIDEASLIADPNLFAQICARVRNYDKNTESQTVFLTSNPSAPAHWLAETFRSDLNKDTHEMILVTPMDNPHLAKDYVENLIRNNTQEWSSKFIHGEFVNLEGLVFKEYNPNLHDVDKDKFSLRDFDKVIIGVDWGSAAPGTMVVVGRRHSSVPASSRSYVVLHEESHKGKLYDDSKGNWFEIALKLTQKYHPSAFACDPASPDPRIRLWNYLKAQESLGKIGGYPEWFVSSGRSGGAPECLGANNDKKMGINLIRSLFLQNKLFIVKENCPALIKELSTLSWDVSKTTSVVHEDWKKSMSDHVVDGKRYALVSF